CQRLPDCALHGSRSERGFFVLANLAANASLLHLEEDVSRLWGWHEITTRPTMREVIHEHDNEVLFHYCAMASGSSGNLFIQAFDELWVVEGLSRTFARNGGSQSLEGRLRDLGF